MHRKLRSAAAVLTIAAAGALRCPASRARRVTVSGYPGLDGAGRRRHRAATTLLEPAIAPAPDGSNAEWFVVSGHEPGSALDHPDRAAVPVASGLPRGCRLPGQLCERRRRRLRLGPRQRPGPPENVLYAVGAADSPSPGLNPVAGFDDYGRGHDARTRRRALHLATTRRHHPVPDHRRARRPVALTAAITAAVLHGAAPSRSTRQRQRRLVHRRRPASSVPSVSERLQRALSIERHGSAAPTPARSSRRPTASSTWPVALRRSAARTTTGSSRSAPATRLRGHRRERPRQRRRR